MGHSQALASQPGPDPPQTPPAPKQGPCSTLGADMGQEGRLIEPCHLLLALTVWARYMAVQSPSLTAVLL